MATLPVENRSTNNAGKAVRRRSLISNSPHHQPYRQLSETRPLAISANRRRSTSSVFAKSPHKNIAGTSKLLSDSEDAELPLIVSTSDRQVQHRASNLVVSDAQSVDPVEQDELGEILSQDYWAASEAALFTRIRRRGREPLLPASWSLDFTTFPEGLYSPSDTLSYICALNPAMEFRGVHALQRLVNVGGQVRDRTEINPSTPIEPLIYQEIKKFIGWAEKDADISLSTLITVTYNRDKNGSSRAASERTERKMRSMADALISRVAVDNPKTLKASKPSYKEITEADATKAPSVIYGITVFNCVAALSTLNCESTDRTVKTLVVLDWSDVGLDIWNAISIALLAISCRNDMLDSNAEARLEIVEQPDEDA